MLDDVDGARDEFTLLADLLPAADDVLAAECRTELRALTERVGDLLRRRPGDLDEREAIVVVRALPCEAPRRADAYEGVRWAELLCSQYIKDAERDGRPVHVYNKSDCADPPAFTATVHISGIGAFGSLKSEHGIHRSEGRPVLKVAVDILAVAVPYDDIRLDDGEIEARESQEWTDCGGPLGYERRSVILTHIPTGITASCSKQESTHLNRSGARTLLRARLLQRRRGAAADQAD
ncbi:PCRF domain-containing protein [Actinomadura physcomitrii]|uniref:PCRF domain-containing protein n=1 Tax=Actinomadura physcomitrii TaxID=2650748 RepID=UPI001923A4B7|nr:PCRF domain-containing protein [Actinomadura physcomitrii]